MLSLERIGKSYGDVDALTDVSMTVDPGSVHCILGENGAGKSTLCNIVFGTTAPSTGTMMLDGKPYRPAAPADAIASGIAMVHQHFSLITTMTVGENLLLGHRGYRLPKDRLPKDRLQTELRAIEDSYGLRVDLDARTSELPVGARQKVEIVKALLRQPRLILLDEPTAVLDPGEIDALIETCRALAENGKSVVMITHKLGEIARVADTSTVLRGGKVTGGGPMAQTTVERLLTDMVGTETATTHSRRVSAPRASNDVALRVENISCTRRDGSDALTDVSVSVRRGEIVGIAGVEGNGQSELASILSGSDIEFDGRIILNGRDMTRVCPAGRTAAGLGVVPEDRHAEGIVADLSVTENLLLARTSEYRRFGMLDRDKMRADATAAISDYSIRTSGPDAAIRSLSGGNQQKVVLARELSLAGLGAIVAAQPTRGLDIGSVGFVLDQLRAAADIGVGVLIISSEMDELMAVCDRILVAYRGRLLGPIDADSTTAQDEITELMMGVAV
ncbi:ABC transporter ATP-binding protein [Rhodococcoides kyotonense]|uniref:Simple sugar transport system ATP-binding protein n=1 Tax=Rhodococcoides kyotonense TaxID=398843 RepID=A0A239EYR3_9NOCA|nr:ABC transporter ATP-binding protein [Rhodococcus kyotonensis]SNS49727.1 simple sugar transport system ATP-binding protein [Rhodococcus kyotonensis]